LRSIPKGFRAKLISALGGPVDRRLARWSFLLPAVAAFEPEVQQLNEYQLRKRSLSLRFRARSGEPLRRIMPEAYALVREAGRRTLNMRHFDVQIVGGIAMFYHSIAEMETGEGKTLTATLPMYLFSLIGKGCHLATVNDYLARRDAEWMKPIYEALGLTVGVIEQPMQRNERAEAYACDVVYGTAKEFGFDFLRDRLLLRRIREGQADVLGGMLGQRSDGAMEELVQREPYFCLVDEADSILIDEARTPLIIGVVPLDGEEDFIESESYKWAASVCDKFVDEDDYEYDHEKRQVELTREGRQKARLLPKPAALDTVGMVTMYEYIERAILVEREYKLDSQYVVRDDEVVIVDEFTGRLAEGRKWQRGIHSAVEAKEGLVKVGTGGGQAARVTIQDFFLRYEHLAGMTGTAMVSARELRRIYKTRVINVPTNRPIVREALAERVFGSADVKWAAVVEEICAMHARGRPVLIGTRSIDKSEHLSLLLQAKGIEHEILNANRIDEEAEIVARAGQRGRVTVSTNMAGRGTDIKLGEGVKELGGLHVICTEMHDSGRIDRQLRGRCGRQGDPGTFRQYLSLDDELLLTAYGPEKADKYEALGERLAGPFDAYSRLFRRAQKKVERRHFRDRRTLMYFEKERKKMHLMLGQDPYLDTVGQ
jgi:preprotein translocase subunit SecA